MVMICCQATRHLTLCYKKEKILTAGKKKEKIFVPAPLSPPGTGYCSKCNRRLTVVRGVLAVWIVFDART